MSAFLRFSAAKPTSARLMKAVLATLLVALAAAYVLSPSTDIYIATAAAMAVSVMGLSILTGFSGQVSIGNAGFMAIGAYTTAIWANHHEHFPIVLSLVGSMAMGALGGIALGLPATRLRGPYLAGMTLAFGYVMSPFIQSLGSFTGGSGGLYFPVLVTPSWFTSLVGEKDNLIGANARYQAVLAIVVAGVALFFAANIAKSRSGRAMRLVRDDDVAAELVGVNLAQTRVTAFALSAALAALGGSLMALVAGAATSSTYGVPLSIELLSLLVLGGMGSISGAILAGILAAYTDVFMTKINSAIGIDPFSNLGANIKGILFGAILIAMMLVAPLGLVGLAKSLFARVTSSRANAN
jgi:branched-chain amino acid transport system permease protein